MKVAAGARRRDGEEETTPAELTAGIKAQFVN